MKKNLKKQIYLILLATAFTFILFKVFFTNSKRINDAMSDLIYPVLIFEYKLISPIKNWFYGFLSLKDKNLLDLYFQENQELKSKIIALESQIDFVNKTKELVDFSKRYNFQYGTLAQIIFKNFDSNEHFYLIDAGSAKSIKPDMCVIYKNFLIGRVKEVYKYYSKVILITDKSCKVAAYSVGTGIKSIHVGQNNINTTKLDFINHLDNLLVGDLVLSSGEGTVFPKGLGLGKIKNFEPEGFDYSVEIETLVQLDKLDYCFVIEKGAEINFKEIPEKEIQASLLAQVSLENKEIKEIKEVKEIKKVKKVQEIQEILDKEVSLDIQDNLDKNVGAPEVDAPVIQNPVILDQEAIV